MSGLFPETMSDLKAYVLAESSGIQNRSDSTVLLGMTHSNLSTTRFPELRFDMHITIARLKEKLYTSCGTSIASMRVVLQNGAGATVAALDDETRMLGYYSPCDHWNLHVIDTDPNSLSLGGGLEDVSLVERRVMSDDEYRQRDNTYAKFRDEKRKEDPTWTAVRASGKQATAAARAAAAPGDDAFEAEAAAISVDQRCEVFPGGRRAAVRYVGRVPELPAGFWVGVQYDEPVGKNDGSAKGTRYFQCLPAYGGFVRPDKVTVGDFPCLDAELNADEM